MKSLGVLQRLAKQAVDRERRTLQLIASEIADIETEIEACLTAIDREGAAPLEFMTSGATLFAYIKAEKERVQSLKVQLSALQERYDAQLGRVQLERVEQKRFELMAERQAKKTAMETAAKEQKTIDELVSIRWGRD